MSGLELQQQLARDHLPNRFRASLMGGHVAPESSGGTVPWRASHCRLTWGELDLRGIDRVIVAEGIGRMGV